MKRKIGAQYKGNGVCEFTVWAPKAKSISVDIVGMAESICLERDELGYWSAQVKDIDHGSLYFYNIDKEKQRPDPASTFQPEGVHGPSQIIDHNSFTWRDNTWKGIPLKDMIIYELHVGTFTPEGTFDGVAAKLGYLSELGINAIEIMPVSQFPGNRNWGYDGVFPFAVQNSYGGPGELKKLVDACHSRGIAVIIDAVYNHLGPEGNYLPEYGPYFTSKYATPWGMAINFDDAYCDEVRNYFIQNALMWVRDYHVDALRLDAVHAIKDFSAKHFLQELTEEVKAFAKESGRTCVLIGECDLNDPKFIDPIEAKGYGLDGQWCDEFHHSLHSIVTGERDGYYSDFGELEHLRKTFQECFVYTGQYSPHRKKTFGADPKDNPFHQFVVFSQNHDHIGNRLLGDRLTKSLSFEALKLTAGTILMSAYVPLLFMGEEFGAENPFMYFVSHTDPDLVEAVRNGRKKEFEYFNWEGEPIDPQAEDTFLKSKVNWDFQKDNKKQTLWNFYKQLIHIKKNHPAFKIFDRDTIDVRKDDALRIITMERFTQEREGSLLYSIMNFGKPDTHVSIDAKNKKWKKVLDSADEIWLGPGNDSPAMVEVEDLIPVRSNSIIVYEKA